MVARTDSPLILLVEDNLSIREAIKMGLELEGYSVVEADNGIAALELLRNLPLPQVILLDMLLLLVVHLIPECTIMIMPE